jgi:hypothetical protein
MHRFMDRRKTGVRKEDEDEVEAAYSDPIGLTGEPCLRTSKCR